MAKLFSERFPQAKRRKSKPRLLSILLSLLKVEDISNSFLNCSTFFFFVSVSLQLTYYLGTGHYLSPGGGRRIFG